MTDLAIDEFSIFIFQSKGPELISQYVVESLNLVVNTVFTFMKVSHD